MIESCSVSLFDCLTKIFTLWNISPLGETCAWFALFLGLTIMSISLSLLYFSGFLTRPKKPMNFSHTNNTEDKNND